PKAVPALIELLKDKGWAFHGSVRTVLAYVGLEMAVPVLVQDLTGKNAAALGRWLGRQFDALDEALKVQDATARELAALALGLIAEEAPLAGQAAVAGLIRGLKDRRNEVRDRSAEALEKIAPGARAAIPALIQALRGHGFVSKDP